MAGANDGISGAVEQRFLAEGARVAFGDLSATPTRTETRWDAAVDISSDESVKALFAELNDAGRTADVVVVA